MIFFVWCICVCGTMVRARKKVSASLGRLIRLVQAALRKRLSGVHESSRYDSRDYMNDEIRRISAELKNYGVNKTMINITFGARYCCNGEAVTYDEKSCYWMFLKTVGGQTSNCKDARELFSNPIAWMRNPNNMEQTPDLLRIIVIVFGGDLASGILPKKKWKEFYTRFYGLCTPKDTTVEDAIESDDAIIKLGILVRLLNALHVTHIVNGMRRHDALSVIQVQFDSITVWLPALKTHPELGLKKYQQACEKGYGDEWPVWLGGQLSNGVSVWEIETHPDVAIFSGVKNLYAMASGGLSSCEDEDWTLVQSPTLKTNPKNMVQDIGQLKSELKDEPEFAKQATFLLHRALYEGPKSFDSVLDQIPEKIERNKMQKVPSLRRLLLPFAETKRKSECYFRLALARAAAGPEDMIIAVPKYKNTRLRKWYVVPQHEFFSDRKDAKYSWRRFAGTEFHEQVHGLTHPFADYDNKGALEEKDIVEMEAHMCKIFRKVANEDVEIVRFSCASLEKPTNRHFSWRITTKTGRPCVLANPAKDMRRLLGPASKKMDSNPWNNSLRFPASPYNGRPGSGYLDVHFLEDDASPFDKSVSPDALAKIMLDEWKDNLTAQDYKNYCVSARGLVNPVVIGTPPNKASSHMKADYLFPSETMLVDLLVHAIKHFTKDEYTMSLSDTRIDTVNTSADTLYRRIQLRRRGVEKRGVLDLHAFAKSILVPFVQGQEHLPQTSDVLHRKSQNSWISIIIPRSMKPLDKVPNASTTRHDKYFIKIRLKAFYERKKSKQHESFVLLPASFIFGLAKLLPKPGDWFQKFYDCYNREAECTIHSTKLPLNKTDSQRNCVINYCDVRNAARERISAKRVPKSARPHSDPRVSFYVTSIFSVAISHPFLARRVQTTELKLLDGLYKKPLPFQTYLAEWVRCIDVMDAADDDSRKSSTKGVDVNMKVALAWIQCAYP